MSDMPFVLFKPRRDHLKPMRRFAALLLACLPLSQAEALPALASAQAPAVAKSDFDIIEGVFHDGLGTFAEIALANELIAQAHLTQAPFDASASRAKMRAAINRLPEGHRHRALFQQEITNIEAATRRGAAELLKLAAPAKLVGVRHTPREYTDAHAGDLRLEFDGGTQSALLERGATGGAHHDSSIEARRLPAARFQSGASRRHGSVEISPAPVAPLQARQR